MTDPCVGNPRASRIGTWSRRLSLAFIGAAAALVFYGCDTVTNTGDTLVLDPIDATFRFEFSSDDVSSGETVTVSSVNTIDLTDELRAFGYGKDEVVFAQVSDASLSRISPLAFRLSSLSDVSVRVVSGSSSSSVASLGALPNATTTDLELGPTRNVQSYVRQPSFSAVLEFVPANLPPDDYVLTVTLELRIEIEDL